jgi:hypothetical protein
VHAFVRFGEPSVPRSFNRLPQVTSLVEQYPDAPILVTFDVDSNRAQAPGSKWLAEKAIEKFEKLVDCAALELRANVGKAFVITRSKRSLPENRGLIPSRQRLISEDLPIKRIQP